jgi:hypothetical protein
MKQFLKVECFFEIVGGKVGRPVGVRRCPVTVNRKPSSSLRNDGDRLVFTFYRSTVPAILGPLVDTDYQEIGNEFRQFNLRMSRLVERMERRVKNV